MLAAGPVALSNGLTVYGAGATALSNAVYLASNLVAAGPVSMNDLTVYGIFSASNAVFLASNLTILGTLSAQNVTSSGGSNQSQSNLVVASNLTVGNCIYASNLSIGNGGSTSISNAVYLASNMVAAGPVLVTGATALSNGLTVYGAGATSLSNAVAVYGTLSASNAVFMASNLTVLGTLTTLNVDYMYSNVTIYQSETIQSNLTVQSVVYASNVLVGSNASFAYGAAFSNATVNVASALNVAGSATLSNVAQSGSASFSNAALGLGVGGALNVAGPLTVAGTSWIGGGALNNKVLALYDAGTADAVATASNFYGFGVNAGALRYQSAPTGSHRWFSGGSNTLALDAVGNLTATANVLAYSDERLKEDIVRIADPLGKIARISGYTYVRKDLPGRVRGTGVLAQEVQAVLPQVVHADEAGLLSVSYGNMVGLLVEGVKELMAANARLSKRLDGMDFTVHGRK